MDIINHQSNGAKGLRIAATVCVVLGWVALLYCVIAAFVAAEHIIFIVPILCGVAALGVMYLTACGVRALASLAEAAQMYFDIHSPHHTEDDDE